MKQKKRKGRSVQQLLGIQTFTKYGLMTDNGELLFYRVAPTNISVLSAANIEIKIRHLQMVLSAIQGKCSYQTPMLLALDLRLSVSGNVRNKFLLCKPPSL